ncbi:unnamed protein product [Parnassius mnemosyne]|uniref:Uncharacterized protein n=1 Tax=Parnassius mnemosyne TaxID=213953 RepID=A0AAV1K7A1_9NEOP
MDRSLMERDHFAPETSRVLPPYSQLPRWIGSSPTTGAALGAGDAVSPHSVEPVPLPGWNLAWRRRTPPQIEEDQLQEEKRLKAGSDSLSKSASPTTPVPTPSPTSKTRGIPPVRTRNTPPESPSPSPTTSPAGMIDVTFEEQDPEGKREWDNTSYATLPPIHQEAEINIEATPGPSSAPHTYASAAAATRTAPPSPHPPAQMPEQPTDRQTAKYPPIITVPSAAADCTEEGYKYTTSHAPADSTGTTEATTTTTTTATTTTTTTTTTQTTTATPMAATTTAATTTPGAAATTTAGHTTCSGANHVRIN